MRASHSPPRLPVDVGAKPQPEQTLSGGNEPLLSIIVISHNMRREVPRTLTSLMPEYQIGVCSDDYEVLVVENGSTEPLDERVVCSAGPNISYHYLENTSPSPARAINYGAARARGRVLGIMIDGACMLTPGVLRMARLAFRAIDNAVVVVQLIGEAVFHQLHGGTTTNTRAADREAKLKRFQQEYKELRGEDFSMPPGLPVSLGHLPQEAIGFYS